MPLSPPGRTSVASRTRRMRPRRANRLGQHRLRRSLARRRRVLRRAVDHPSTRSGPECRSPGSACRCTNMVYSAQRSLCTTLCPQARFGPTETRRLAPGRFVLSTDARLGFVQLSSLLLLGDVPSGFAPFSKSETEPSGPGADLLRLVRHRSSGFFQSVPDVDLARFS